MKSTTAVLFFIVFVSLAVPCLGRGKIGIISEMIHTKEAQPGETYETTIVIKNFGEREVRIRVYPQDYSYNSEGDQFFHPAGSMERSNAGWITSVLGQDVISPEETAEVRCVVRVPEEKILIGTYWSLVMVEPVLEVSNGQFETQDGNDPTAAAQVLRYAIQIID